MKQVCLTEQHDGMHPSSIIALSPQQTASASPDTCSLLTANTMAHANRCVPAAICNYVTCAHAAAKQGKISTLTGKAAARRTSAAPVACGKAGCAAALGSTELSSQPGLRRALLSGRARWLRPACVDRAAHASTDSCEYTRQ